MEAAVRDAVPSDLPRLVALEGITFDPARRTDRDALRRSLRNPCRRVRVMEAPPETSGAPATIRAATILVLYRRTLRVYSVGVHPDWQGKGLGKALMADAEALARTAGLTAISLEADAANAKLLAWYEKQGFRVTARLPAYYGISRDAVRMRKALPAAENNQPSAG